MDPGASAASAMRPSSASAAKNKELTKLKHAADEVPFDDGGMARESDTYTPRFFKDLFACRSRTGEPLLDY